MRIVNPELSLWISVFVSKSVTLVNEVSYLLYLFLFLAGHCSETRVVCAVCSEPAESMLSGHEAQSQVVWSCHLVCSQRYSVCCWVRCVRGLLDACAFCRSLLIKFAVWFSFLNSSLWGRLHGEFQPGLKFQPAHRAEILLRLHG